MIRREPDEVAARLRPVLEAMPQVRSAWLFGSVARGDAIPSSDVDVAVHLDPGLDAWKFRLQAADRLSRELGTDAVQVVVLRDAPLSLRMKIHQEGILLIDRAPEEREELERWTLLRWWDEEPRLRRAARATAEALIREGRKHGS